MNILHKAKFFAQPAVSLVLLDWSVRESFHTLEYLNHQKCDRNKYEIVWIEYYDRVAPEIG